MNRRHYKMIAAAIQMDLGLSTDKDIVRQFVDTLCEAFKRDNQAFNATKFKEACGL